MIDTRFVILGGGMVAGYSAKQMVEAGLKPGELTIVSADSSLPYERPPLSKGFLSGKETEESIRINSQDFYCEHGIEVKLNCEVVAVDCRNKRLTMKSGDPVGFGKLLIATGACPRWLNIPGEKLGNVHYLRSLQDSSSIRHSAVNAKQAVVIGGGFIGMEVASVLAQKNIAVTMVLNEERIWKRLFTPEMSHFFESYYLQRGVRFSKVAKVIELRGTQCVSSTVLSNGEILNCDLVVAGIGAQPSTKFLEGSGLEVNDGVMVNEYLETNHSDISAAGDIANYPDLLFGKRRRVEHWDNAVTQGQHCGRLLLGERVPFKHVPYFFSDVFDLSYEYWGDSSGADRVVYRGDVSTNSFSSWWLSGNLLVAAFIMNRPDEERETAPRWIENKQKLSSEQLQNDAKDLAAAAF
jgi:NADPH-dependent 2,4-dienoyl-CoA reductase/sulfur reductase-like enzyme